MIVGNKKIEKPISNKFWTAHNSKDIFLFGECEIKNVVETGQPTLECYDTEQELIDRLTELTGDSNYYVNNQ